MSHRSPPAQSGHKIGSVHLGRLTFSNKEHLFHLDTRFQDLKKDVRSSVDIDILNLRQQRWNPGVAAGHSYSVDHLKHLFEAVVSL